MSGEGEKEVVLVTGGSGFLGQHLIRELQLHHSKSIKEIRIADKKIFRKFLEYPSNIPVKEYIADVVEEQEMEEVMRGVTSVFHLAARPYGLDMYDDKTKQWEDSVISTKTVISLMGKYGVEWLVYVGDALSVVQANQDILNPSEMATLEPPASKKWMLGHHGEAKFRAEQIVRKSNGREFDEDAPRKGTIKTVVIRPTIMYGEGDNWIVANALELAKQYDGKLYQIGDGKNIIQLTYAGNVAAMLCEAWRSLEERKEEMGGEVFFCTEANEPINYFQFITPFVESAGFKMVPKPIPYYLALYVFWCLNKIFGLLSLVDLYFYHNLPNYSAIHMVGGSHLYFSCTKARLMFDWKPPYDPKDAMRKSIAWWKKNNKVVFS